MSLALYRLGKFAATNWKWIIAAWLVAGALVITLSRAYGSELEDTFDVPGLDSQEAFNLLESSQSESAGLTARVVATPKADGVTFFESVDAQKELAEIVKELNKLENIVAVTDPAAALTQSPEMAIQSGSVSVKGKIALINIQYEVIENLSVEDLEILLDLREDFDSELLQVEMGGELVNQFEEPQTGTGEMLGILAAVIILLIAFGSVIAMGLPIGMAAFGLTIGISSMKLLDYLIDIPSWAPQMGSMVGLGVGIDYALFVVTRHREYLVKGMTVVESAGRSIATAGQAVVFAGGTVMVAILGMAFSGVPFMTAAGVATAVIVLIMVAASITLLPAFLGLAGHWINRLTIHRKGYEDKKEAGAGWERWGKHVSKYAWPYLIVTTAVLLLMAAPVLSLKLGFPDDGTSSEKVTQRRAYDLITEGFGPGINGPLIIAVDISKDASVVESIATAVEADEGISMVAPADVNTEAGVATIVAFPNTSPQDEETYETIKRLRAGFPAVLADSPAKAHVGGITASFADIGERINNRLLLFISAVILLSFVLLMFVFRSILVPIKAALLNLLSIGAAYGVLVAVFQWGWGLSLIGLDSTVPIVSFIPMFMFAILFGLSMDYEVFLLSRIREEYLISGDNEESVIKGISNTARVITSAALIMICVFFGFVLGDNAVIKMLGLGLATAILVDATIVRIILVPASMKLMGDANWWIPKWLDKLLPTIDIDGEEGLPDPEMESSLA